MDFKEFKGGRQRSFFGYFVVGVVGAVVGAFTVLLFAPAGLFPSSSAPVQTPTTTQVQKVEGRSEKVSITTDVSTAAAAVSPSVVGVVTTKLERNLYDQTKKTQGVGSGIIVDASGYILTNNHVANMSASSITVMTSDGKEHKATPVWSDPALDLSVIKVETTGLSPAKMGDSSVITVGEPAIAIGNPLGLTFQRTVTSGIVSAINRTLEIERGVFMEDLIQTDASINPGNSGGPLLNIKGEVIGVNTAKVSTAEGIGFAVPINIIKPVLESIIATGKFEAPYIGITGFDKEISGYYGLDVKAGVYVAKLDRVGPAALAGIREKDIILQVDGKPTNTMMDFREALYLRKPGETVKVKVQDSKGATRDIDVTLKKHS
ncbi:S1C family serine protease [Clostridium cylindrosporum]|uniref:Serine protease Do-like HtrA n=1 Tax=Clostridium cylindrosporum DSM 605 TaxID=1121307 RepID=A0A0J8DC95_CLOCY|nr:trypsin-like peptidase domain-containing protein [Clostridium cylindrosporum]KMT21878.1 serine protease Do-like HtrA [Clostridium cylindrosporum DSM 605]